MLATRSADLTRSRDDAVDSRRASCQREHRSRARPVIRFACVRVLIVALIVATSRIADAEAERVVVVSVDEVFRLAVAEALVTDGTAVQIASDEPPASVGDLTTASRAITEREAAIALVWLLFEGNGGTLIVYDRGVDRVLVRSLPYPAPLGAVQAAEAARVTRTMLHALRVDTEPPLTKRPPPVSAEPPRVIATVSSSPPDKLAIEVDGGIRVRVPGAPTALAGTVGVVWRPDRVGLAIAARFAPSATLDGMVVGRISDHSVALMARWPLPMTRRLGVAVTTGIAVHRIALDGELDGEVVRDRRYDPAMRLGLGLSYSVKPSIGLGVAVSSDWLLRRQTYEVGPDEVLTVPLAQFGAGIVLSARIL